MKTNEKQLHFNKSSSAYFLSKKNIFSPNEESHSINEKEFHEHLKEENIYKQKNNTKKNEEKNILNQNIGDKTMNLKNKNKEKITNEKSNRKEKNTNPKKKERGINNISNNNTDKKDNSSIKVSSPNILESNKNNCDYNLTKKKNLNKTTNTKKNVLNKSKTVENKLKAKSSFNNEIKKIHNRSRTKRVKSIQNIVDNTEMGYKTTQFKLSDYSENDSNLENLSVEYVVDKEEKIKNIKEKTLQKYNDLIETYTNNIKTLINSNSNDNLKIEFNRETIFNFLKITYKYSDYNYSVTCAILLLLDRLNNPEIELTEKEKEGLENALRAYSYHSIISYKYTFKAYHKKDSIIEQKVNSNLQLKKNICKNIRQKIKIHFLLNCEIIINLINCILYTINEDQNKIYYIYLNGNQYKIISDITETGVKYKYEHLAQEAYKKALDLGKKYMQPTDVNYLNLASSYIYFLYFILGYEQKALNLCIDIFDKSSNLLDKIEDHENVDKCLQLLSKMRYNIKRWSKKLNKNSILFLTF
ncbi:14-3-3 protein, putative [Plasmodium gallinaceum]|uniref:14-3-3 protein, putative n=1 Tax=Plasmodium gallinaceum TaxID=5849 RepID=A0A1J1GT85_PLAGA|nr:14-3-3 protein, putative [Plasmodium gallinaceum]CRG95742.1 14-3-3 protein, putative [Plasmodium gallinaceum]